ncbi:CIA30 family protein [Allorhodopirellula solitaria]|uniref:Complex I intermediate-associated protein 30 (CIA30) n=1 Tax=Allorhodopirellula solitaria TaxID=2527987 RepID=A0A5C5WM45_9BACT|nr:CIA30 family protein [Allorhodopirellula solitaria]TWT51680.1 Complex I intermediate-associated protein 30 (CIA30) [Allorhodopirellula solitaria]
MNCTTLVRCGFLVLLWTAVLPDRASAEDLNRVGVAARTLFDFGADDSPRGWRIVNDGVMGGRSTSKFSVVDEGVARFAGQLSLENNGGFASVRSAPKDLGLQSDQTISLRVRGDGRRYTLCLYAPDRRTAFSFQSEFDTVKNEWIEARLPIAKFVANSYGRKVPGVSIDPRTINSLGILLGDKQAGPFELQVDWIKVAPAEGTAQKAD